MHCIQSTAILLLLTIVSQSDAQSFRAGYKFGSGTAWSASVKLPSYDITDLGKGHIPLDVNDHGTVIMRSDAHALVRWTWGKGDVLLDYHVAGSQAFINNEGVTIALDASNSESPEVLYWMPGSMEPLILQTSEHLLAKPYHIRLCAFNDRNEVALSLESTDTPGFFPPKTIQIETNRVNIKTGAWEELAMYQYFQDINMTSTQGGRLHDIRAMNNYGMTVGEIYEDQATASAWNPDPVYSYQNQSYYLNSDTVLGFEPLGINDAGTITGRTPGPIHGMLALDAFGERYLDMLVDDTLAGSLRMSNPLDGAEEIILGPHYLKRMQERDLDGMPTLTPSPDFWKGNLPDIIPDTGGWHNLEAHCISANGRIAGTGWVYNPAIANYEKHAFLLSSSALVPDWDRNGAVDISDQLMTKPSQPFYFWINDDNDEGELYQSSRDDLPASDTPDWATPGIDGPRDVVDFFTVHIDLQNILQSIGPDEQVEVILKHQEEGINFVYTNLFPREVGALHQELSESGFGPDFTEPLNTAPTQVVTSEGVRLQDGFIENIRSENRGIILVECTKASTEPLVLELHREGETILTSKLPLSISPVEEMFRVINLRNADPKFAGADPGPWPTRTIDPPNLPDSFLLSLDPTQRTLIHVHGFNWSGNEAPAAHAELFKRFFQSGSSARFVGVTWRGDEGTLELTGSSFEYNENVINAFITAKYLAESLQPFSGANSSVFAHSLGNMVVSSAIVDHGLNLSNYFMVNAAVPAESYNGETSDRRHMVHPDWKDEGSAGLDYPEHLLSPNWHRLFPYDDPRSFLKWKGRFAGIEHLTTCVNYYSTGEDVLKTGSGDIPSLTGDALNQELVWVFNEMVKGTSTLAATLSTDIHGGWGFNREYMDWVDPGGAAHPPPGSWIEMPPSEAAALDPSLLVSEPFFLPFSSGDSDFPAWGDGAWLYDSTEVAINHLPSATMNGADMGQIKNHAKIIAEAVPAHSAPTGSNPISNLFLQSNIDLDLQFREPGNWPSRPDIEKRDRWLHSDYLKPALSSVAKLYLNCIKLMTNLP